MLPRKPDFFSFLVPITYLILSFKSVSRAYIFEEIKIRYFTNAIGDNISQQRLEEHPLSRMNLNVHDELCAAVHEHTSVPLVKVPIVKQEVGKFAIHYFDGKFEVHIALICATVPRLLLRSDEDDPNKLLVMVEDVRSWDNRWHFDLEVVQTVTYRAANNDLSRKLLDEHYLSSLGNPIRWEICIAAKRQFQGDVILDVISRNNWYEIVALYDILYPDGSEEKDTVAFRCSSHPKTTYLRLRGKDSRKRFTIMVVQPEPRNG